MTKQTEVKRYELSMCDDYPECDHALCGVTVVRASDHDAAMGELQREVARLGAKVSALDSTLGTVIAERDALVSRLTGELQAAREAAYSPHAGVAWKDIAQEMIRRADRVSLFLDAFAKLVAAGMSVQIPADQIPESGLFTVLAKAKHCREFNAAMAYALQADRPPNYAVERAEQAEAARDAALADARRYRWIRSQECGLTLQHDLLFDSQLDAAIDSAMAALPSSAAKDGGKEGG